MIFKDRQDAGRQLATQLQKYYQARDVVVIGLARGGVITAREVANALHLPLQVLVVRKIGAPQNEELAIGAITQSGEGIFNDHLIDLLGVSSDYIQSEIEKQKKLAQKRESLYQGNAPSIDLKGKKVILVDDGIATGSSILVAIQAIKKRFPSKIILAIPVASPDSLKKISSEVDETVCLSRPVFFESVGGFYHLFDQTTDEEIIRILDHSKRSIA